MRYRARRDSVRREVGVVSVGAEGARRRSLGKHLTMTSAGQVDRLRVLPSRSPRRVTSCCPRLGGRGVLDRAPAGPTSPRPARREARDLRSHLGLKAAIASVFIGSAWQRCRVHFMRTVLSRPKPSRKWSPPYGLRPTRRAAHGLPARRGDPHAYRPVTDIAPPCSMTPAKTSLNRPGSDGGSGYWIPTPSGSVCWAA